MSDYRNDKSRSTVRLGAAGSSSAGMQPHWFYDDRFLSFVPGAMMSFIIACGVELSAGTAHETLGVVIGSLVGWLPIAAARSIIRKFKPEYKDRGGWTVIGVAVGIVVFTPLIVTPECGFWGDKCKPAQISHHHVHQ